MTTPRTSRAPLYFFLVLLAGALLIAYRLASPYLMALFMGALLALLFYPLYEKLRRKKMGPKSASLLVTLGVILLVIGPTSAFAILAVRQGIVLGQKLSDNEGMSLQAMTQRLTRWGPVEKALGDPAALRAQLRDAVRAAGRFGTAALVKIATTVPEFLIQLALASIACFFLLIDGKRALHWSLSKAPLDDDVRDALLTSFRDTAVSTVWATLAAAGVQALLMLGSYLVLGVPGAFLAGGATFILSWVPMVGSVPVWITGAIYLLTQGDYVKMALMVVFGIITGAADNLVRPWVMKGRDDMHPLVSLVAILGGIDLFGILGVFVGPILAALLLSLLDTWPEVGRRFGLTFHSPKTST